MKKIKSPLEGKYLLKILSVLAAIALWFAITYSEDPVLNATVSNINLNIIGEHNLEKNNLVLVERNKLNPISIEVKGKRSDVKSVLNNTAARIDLSDITEPGEYTRDVTFDVANPSVMITKKRTSSLTVNVERAVTKEIPVFVKRTGANKTYLIESIPEVDTVKIQGAKKDIDKIEEVLLSVDVEDIREDGVGTYLVTYADENHSIYTPDNKIISNKKEIVVTNKVYLRKSVSVALNPDLDISGYQIFVKNFSKSSVEIGTKPDDFNSVNTIYADFVGGIVDNSSGKYQMKLIVPDGVYCPSKDEELIMTAEIERIITKDITLDIAPENVPPSTSAHLSQPSVIASLTGAESKMKDVKAKVDLSGLGKGTHDVSVVFVTDNTGVVVNSSHNIQVEIK